MSDYIDEFESLFSRLAAMNAEMQEDMQIAILLVSLSDAREYENVVSAIKTLTKGDLNWDEVTSRLLEEARCRPHMGRQATAKPGELLLASRDF